MKKIIFLFLLLSHHLSHGTFTFTGNAALPLTFTEIILAETYDPCTRAWYLALDNAGGGAGTFAVSKLNPGESTFTGIATSPLLNNLRIDFLTHAKTRGKSAPFLAAVDDAADGQTIAVTTDGSLATQSAILNDAIGAATTAIVNLAAKDSQIFSIVEPAVGAFGAANGGVAVVNVTAGTLAQDEVNAQTGTPGGNTAQFLDGLLANTPSVVIAADLLAMFANTSIFYDDVLNLLFLGVAPVPGLAAGNGARSVVVSDVASSGLLTFRNIIPNALFVNGVLTNIVGATSSGALMLGQAAHLDVLHASTGPSYLIVNSGFYAFPVTNNKANFISALPLINNPATPAIHGTIANKNSALVNGKFITAPTVNADLPVETEAAVRVGAGPLPVAVLTGFVGTSVTDIKVVGDTVYVASSNTIGPSDENGIFYSTALFDETGKIVRWTPWAKKAAPLDLFPALVPGTIPVAERGKVQFFEIDPVTSETLFVDGHVDTSAGRNAWTTAGTATGLVTNVNNLLSGACTAILDLPRSTRGFGTAVGNGRYALFGSNEQIVFAKLSEAKASATGAEDIIEPFSPTTNPDHILNTTLPPNAGPVKVIEYSRRLGGTADGYFFAGTDTGLFAFASATGDGFNVGATALGDLNAAPFTGRTWQAAPNPELQRAVIDIKTSGRALYCLTCLNRKNSAPEIKVLRIPFTTNISTMFASTNIFTIAQAGTGVFEDVLFFNGLEIVATNDPRLIPTAAADTEQLVLATNKGIFVSRADQSGGAGTGIITAANQTAAAWQRLNATNNTFFFGNATHDTPVRHTSWYISSTSENFIFNKSNIHQLSGAGTPGSVVGPPLFPLNFNPRNFNKVGTADPLDQITTFWSDGGRRIIATFNNSDSQLQSVAFDSNRWCGNTPNTLTDATLNSATNFNWVRNLHNGSLMAGTDQGIVALQ